jgi:CHASE1-domain containing sensor protein
LTDDCLMDAPPALDAFRGHAVARFLLPLLIVAAALVVQALVVHQGERRERARVEARAERVADALERRVNAYSSVLYGVRGLLGASRRVTAREFHLSHEAREVELRYPGLKVVGFGDLLRRDEITARARQVRAEARASGLPYPRFAIHPRTRAARVAPITYIEPQAATRRRSASTSSPSRTPRRAGAHAGERRPRGHRARPADPGAGPAARLPADAGDPRPSRP